jgi:hypothetical protein
MVCEQKVAITSIAPISSAIASAVKNTLHRSARSARFLTRINLQANQQKKHRHQSMVDPLMQCQRQRLINDPHG